jgi:hypothetical protein
VGTFASAFFAFPAKPDELVATIIAASEAAEATGKVTVKPWPAMDIFGACLADEVRNEISKADVLFATSRGTISMSTMKLDLRLESATQSLLSLTAPSQTRSQKF